ncbi:DUF5071 domain-containing protein [Hymenobacter sp. 15J16-1T3B]|uniref:DUF5071 domain-containing protein n=1 Tax=Hymenobacter sp. 15J16-1T3B TaxID=2886941 RepID=UPI001D124ACE|nr:DUF5071 domain-containing protein [Hymenobacter sp. 15J16-1T3B]MCC3159637.1 DUF5071 domain-containing protein [Hymenobacter sp. 15J16-1T3B]
MSKEAAALPPRRIVPAHPADYQAVHNLRRVDDDRILAELDGLLAWTQDGTWPVARGVGEVLALHFPVIRPAVLQILRGADARWKHAFLGLVVDPVLRAQADADVLRELRRLAQHPTPAEQAEHVAERALALLDDLGL